MTEVLQDVARIVAIARSMVAVSRRLIDETRNDILSGDTLAGVLSTVRASKAILNRRALDDVLSGVSTGEDL